MTMTTEKKILKKESFSALIIKLISDQKRVLGPVKNGDLIDFTPINAASDLAEDYILTVSSAKSTVFPKIEKLFSFTSSKEGNTITDVDLNAIPEQVLIGARPCDALGFTALNAIFTWDSKDTIFMKRLEKTIVIGMSCNKCDDYCFCTSVGGNPGSTAGSDILLSRMNDGNFLAEIVTEKGNKFYETYNAFFEPAGAEARGLPLADVPVKFEAKAVSAVLENFFESEVWAEQSMRCIGCGACAFVCPTCACFDIQDEKKGKDGLRLRLWDSCGLSLFTLHTSGHNPRSVQSQRWRQRILHKFSYMPERLNMFGCVGCGRCSRACPADMNIIEHLSNLMEVKK